MGGSASAAIAPHRREAEPRAALGAAAWLLSAALLAALALGVWAGTLYSSTDWWLAGLLGLSGVALGVAAAVRWAASWSPVAVVGAVAAAQLAGTAVVATKHWGTYFGYTGLSEHLLLLKTLAVLMGAACVAACVVVLRRLVAWGAIPVPARPVARWVAIICGAAVLAGLPLALGSGSPEDRDVTSLLAFALIYSVPWGVAIIVSGWLQRVSALAALASVAAAIVLAIAGPPMTALFLGPQPKEPFVAALAVVIGAAVVRTLERRPDPIRQ